MPATEQEILRNLSVIVARKTDYLQSLLARLGRDLRRLSPGEGESLREGLARAVSEMGPRLFVTRSEISARRLNPRVRLEDLNQEAIWRELERSLTRG